MKLHMSKFPSKSNIYQNNVATKFGNVTRYNKTHFNDLPTRSCVNWEKARRKIDKIIQMSDLANIPNIELELEDIYVDTKKVDVEENPLKTGIITPPIEIIPKKDEN